MSLKGRDRTDHYTNLKVRPVKFLQVLDKPRKLAKVK